MLLQALLSIPLLPQLSTSLTTSLSNPNPNSTLHYPSGTFEDFITEITDLFIECEVGTFNKSWFQILRVDNEPLGLTPHLNLLDYTTFHITYFDLSQHILFGLIYDVDGYDNDVDRELAPWQENHPLTTYPDTLRGTTFADALAFAQEKFPGLKFLRCQVVTPTKDPFRGGERGGEVMWLFYTTLDWPPDWIWAVDTGLTMWGRFTKEELDVRVWPYEGVNGNGNGSGVGRYTRKGKAGGCKAR